MLYCAADKLFLSADQVLSKISPNVSVWAVEPHQNSLGEYLASLASLTTSLPYDVLVLPGHGVPFYGLKTRIKQLADHHEERCRLIADACREVPQTSKELVPVVFHKHVLDAHQMGFAAGELIAHVNYMASPKGWAAVSGNLAPPEGAQAEIGHHFSSSNRAPIQDEGGPYELTNAETPVLCLNVWLWPRLWVIDGKESPLAY